MLFLVLFLGGCFFPGVHAFLLRSFFFDGLFLVKILFVFSTVFSLPKKNKLLVFVYFHHFFFAKKTKTPCFCVFHGFFVAKKQKKNSWRNAYSPRGGCSVFASQVSIDLSELLMYQLGAEAWAGFAAVWVWGGGSACWLVSFFFRSRQ